MGRLVYVREVSTVYPSRWCVGWRLIVMRRIARPNLDLQHLQREVAADSTADKGVDSGVTLDLHRWVVVEVVARFMLTTFVP